MVLFDQGRALVIGIGTYLHAPHYDVPVTLTDAETIARNLTDPTTCGYDPARVQTLYRDQATRSNILAALDTLAAGAPTDTVLIFYSGLGDLDTNSTFHLTTHDTHFANDHIQPGTAIAERELLDKLNVIPAKRTVLIFNACRLGAIAPAALSSSDEPAVLGQNLPRRMAGALLGTGEGAVIITACREDQQSYLVRTGERTIFAETLSNGLQGEGVRNRKGFISLFDLYSFLHDTVKETVYERWGRDQEPVLTVHPGIGEMAIALYRGREPQGTLEGVPRPGTLGSGRQVVEVPVGESQRLFQQIMGLALEPIGTDTQAINIAPRATATVKQLHRKVLDFGQGNQIGSVSMGNVAGRDQVNIGGDVAGGDIDKRKGAFVEGGTVYGPVTGSNAGSIHYSYNDSSASSSPSSTPSPLRQVHVQVRQAVMQARNHGQGDLAYELARIERDLDDAVGAENAGDRDRRSRRLQRALAELQALVATYPALRSLAQALAQVQ